MLLDFCEAIGSMCLGSLSFQLEFNSVWKHFSKIKWVKIPYVLKCLEVYLICIKVNGEISDIFYLYAFLNIFVTDNKLSNYNLILYVYDF